MKISTYFQLTKSNRRFRDLILGDAFGSWTPALGTHCLFPQPSQKPLQLPMPLCGEAGGGGAPPPAEPASVGSCFPLSCKVQPRVESPVLARRPVLVIPVWQWTFSRPTRLELLGSTDSLPPFLSCFYFNHLRSSGHITVSPTPCPLPSGNPPVCSL